MKNHVFKAEIGEMLDLVVNSLYSKKEIFLRELVSNASDAIDRAKYQALTDPSLISDAPVWQINITADKNASTLSISDNGSGMDEADLEKNLGTIASSGTKAFREALKKSNGTDLPELIGQFGVGFYAAFMVADRVEVVSKKRGQTAAFSWASAGSGTYEVGEAERDGFGTTVTLHLREEFKEFLNEWSVSELVKKYSDFIAYPIYFTDAAAEKKPDDPKEPPKPLNTMVALWKRAKKDVKPEEYEEFYKHLSRDWTAPAETIHFSGEGQVEFKALLFIPKEAGMEIYMPQTKHGLSLYVRNVFIGNDFDMLLPDYLRFVRGVVDSADLPLNVSREMLQDDAVIRKIKQAVTGKILSTLEDMKKRPDSSAFDAFSRTFGRILKEGMRTDYANAERIKKLVKYPSAKTESGKTIFLEDYVKAMSAGQSEIYYLAAERDEDARKAPQLEKALKSGADVLLFTDPVDEWLVDDLREFDGKKLVDIAKGSVSFGTEAEKKAEKAAAEKAADEMKPFLEAVKDQLKDTVADVRISTRLVDSPACLVAAENAPSPAIERMMKAMGQEVPKSKRTLEINPAHPLVVKMQTLESADRRDAVDLLYGLALVAEGSPVPDPARFTALVCRKIV